MDDKTRLILALHQVEGISGLTENNPYRQFLYGHLCSIKCELERQLSLLNDGKEIRK
jgi:hypothetical protein|tara:strand:- start:965 stop:1135 length:171 start_codon:yes stop_codon:yes gene_type:complete